MAESNDRNRTPTDKQPNGGTNADKGDEMIEEAKVTMGRNRFSNTAEGIEVAKEEIEELQEEENAKRDGA